MQKSTNWVILWVEENIPKHDLQFDELLVFENELKKWAIM